MAPALYRVPAGQSGRLWIMPCPRGEFLSADITHYARSGVDRIVSMLEVAEAQRLGLETEEALCGQAGMTFRSCPIRDFGLPQEAVFDALVEDIATAIRSGTGVAVHCRAGIGRSGMVVAAVLVALGSTDREARAKVSRARGVQIPDTVEQGSFITSYAQRISRDHDVTI